MNTLRALRARLTDSGAARILMTELLGAYSSILFVDKFRIGGLFLLATLWFPWAGAAGLLAAGTGMIAVRLFHYSHGNVAIFNSLLAGLSLGALYQPSVPLLPIIALTALAVVLISAVSADLLWRLDRLPALSLPFVMVTLTAILGLQGSFTPAPHSLPEPVLPEPMNGFFTAMGNVFFTPHPIPGALIFLGLLSVSRYLAGLAVAGYTAGHLTLAVLSGTTSPGVLSSAMGFNFILAAIAIGGVFTLPGWRSTVLGLLGAAFAALLGVAAQRFLQPYGLPVLAAPFVLTTLLLLSALRKRGSVSPPYVVTETPTLPEVNIKQARLAKQRGLQSQNVPLKAPFLGTWQVYQGFNGRFTHQPPWQHALDFHQTVEGRGFKNQGRVLSDYYCFGLPVCSPAYGKVVACQDSLPDNKPGEVDTLNNWGNFVLIRLAGGPHVLLAHLRQHSLRVSTGDWVVPMQTLAHCGNSGRSPQPHLHMQVQSDAALGSPTTPFHLSGVLMTEPETDLPELSLNLQPAENTGIAPLMPDEILTQALHLPVGRCLDFQVRVNDQDWRSRRLTVELTLQGQFRLVSDGGASAAFEESGELLAFYDRSGPADPFLDGWLLALGLTTFEQKDCQWRDSASVDLLPLTMKQRLWRRLVRPFDAGLESRYRRRYHGETGCWRQSASHRFKPVPGRDWGAKTLAFISPTEGCIGFEVQANHGFRLEAKLQANGLSGDNGVPAWTRFSGVNPDLAEWTSGIQTDDFLK